METTFYAEKTQKIWAMTPKPEFETFESIHQYLQDRSARIRNALGSSQDGPVSFEINNDNLLQVLQLCVAGLAHSKHLAERRMYEVLERPRKSSSRLYQQSFVEADYHKGALAVVAFTAMNDSQPEEWVVEGFIGGAVVPEERTLPMYHPTTWGIDMDDYTDLNSHIERWYPSGN